MEKELIKLINDGWTEFPQCYEHSYRCFFKEFQTEILTEKLPCVVAVRVCCFITTLNGCVNYKLHLERELQDGSYIAVKQERLPMQLENVLPKIPPMIEAWKALGNFKDIPPKDEKYDWTEKVHVVNESYERGKRIVELQEEIKRKEKEVKNLLTKPVYY